MIDSFPQAGFELGYLGYASKDPRAYEPCIGAGGSRQ